MVGLSSLNRCSLRGHRARHRLQLSEVRDHLRASVRTHRPVPGGARWPAADVCDLQRLHAQLKTAWDAFAVDAGGSGVDNAPAAAKTVATSDPWG
jgi:hypothetical protein